MNLDTDLIPFTKINSKYITHLSVKGRILKLLEGNIRENLDTLGLAMIFRHNTKSMFHKTKVINLDFNKLKHLCSTKNTVKI